MTGSFQEHMQHKMLSEVKGMSEIRASSPAINARADEYMTQLHSELPNAEHRMVMTWRKVETHAEKAGLRCPMNTLFQEAVNPGQPMRDELWKPLHPATSCRAPPASHRYVMKSVNDSAPIARGRRGQEALAS